MAGPLCALLWRILTWCTSKQVILKARHIPGWLNVVAYKLSRLGQTIQTEWPLLPVVFQTICNRWHQPQIDLFATRFISKVAKFVSPMLDPGLGRRCTQPAIGGSGPICLPTSSHLGQSGVEVTRLPMRENHSDCSRVAQHALVLAPSGHVQPYPTEPVHPAHTTIQSDSAQETVKPKSTCVAPRASAIKEQGFSEAVAV